MRTTRTLLPLLLAAACASTPEAPGASVSTPQPLPDTPAGDPDAPRYKPSASSPAPVDITTNAYGAYSAAPDAPEIGDVARDFTLPLADGGTFELAQARKAGPVLVMFYRGFW
ncbi:MAG: hypothetical protein ACE37F_28790 [Nannocystaceae bacterium]|nr:hypothetical protein [bacterium]